MPPLPHTLAKARRLWHLDYDAQYAQMPTQRCTRTHGAVLGLDGAVLRPARTEQYDVRLKPVPTTAKDLMTDLIFLSLRALERRNRSAGAPELADALLEAPALSVNRLMLGARCSLSARTVRTHLARLQQLGAITRKAWHGSSANFELWINTKYLWDPVETTGEDALEGQRLGALLRSESPKLPHNVAFVTLETEKPETITGGDKWTRPAAAANRPGSGSRLAAEWELATQTGNTGLQVPGLAAGAEMQVAPGGDAGSSDLSNRPSQTQQRQMVTAFWDKAQPCLYPGSHFTEAEHARVLNAIWKGVYGGFGSGWLPDAWARYHAEALERIKLVTGWLARHPGHYLPTPYAEVVAGRGYFDAENGQGFSGTREWLATKMKRQRARRLELAQRQAAAELRGWRLKTAPGKVLAQTLPQLTQHHHANIRTLGGPVALDRFLRMASGQA